MSISTVVVQATERTLFRWRICTVSPRFYNMDNDDDDGDDDMMMTIIIIVIIA